MTPDTNYSDNYRVTEADLKRIQEAMKNKPQPTFPEIDAFLTEKRRREELQKSFPSQIIG